MGRLGDCVLPAPGPLPRVGQEATNTDPGDHIWKQHVSKGFKSQAQKKKKKKIGWGWGRQKQEGDKTEGCGGEGQHNER